MDHANEESVALERLEIIQFSGDGRYYLVPRIGREKFPGGGMVWLETATHPLPVGHEWHTPNLFGAAVIRGRNYWRRFTRAHLYLEKEQKELPADDLLVRDYADFAWWTPGLEEAWAEADASHEAVAELRGEANVTFASDDDSKTSARDAWETGDAPDADSRGEWRKKHGGE